MTTKDRPLDALQPFIGLALMLVWVAVPVALNSFAPQLLHAAYLEGYTTIAGMVYAATAFTCWGVLLYIMLVGIIAFVGMTLPDPWLQKYSAFIDRTIGKVFGFRTTARIIRPFDR